MNASRTAPDAEGVRWLDAGDAAVTIEFGRTLEERHAKRVAAFDAALVAAQAAGALPGVEDIVPTFRSVTVLYDPLRTRRGLLMPVLQQALDAADAGLGAAAGARRWRLPACYDPAFGEDLADVAAAKGLAVAEVVALHAGATYRVGMLGFMPGFAFMRGVVPQLAMPRRREPRVRVPAGSVAMTGPLTAIYPWTSPGGWQLLGRCPLPLFDARAARPALLAPGDDVRFEPIDRDAFERLAERLARDPSHAEAFGEAMA